MFVCLCLRNGQIEAGLRIRSFGRIWIRICSENSNINSKVIVKRILILIFKLRFLQKKLRAIFNMVDPGLFVFRDAACTDQDPIILDIWILKRVFLATGSESGLSYRGSD